MMAEPKQKSLELPAYLTRVLPLWQTPQWLEADRWRRTVANQPVAMICQDTLISDIIAADWRIKARDDNEDEELEEDIDHYTDVLNSAEALGGIRGFDNWAQVLLQDMLTLPIGGNTEIIRYPNGGPLDRPHPKGHVFKLVFIDGATLYPTFDRDFPIAQRIRQNLTTVIYFAADEIGRMVMAPRPELERWGYGMAPPEKIFLALSLLYRGDTYYANLLLDTPEAGLLDLMDMSYDSAANWLQSFRELMTGIDPMKIPVLYEHEKPANYINFGRPPTEMMFAETTGKYSRITHAGYGLTETDTGLGDAQRTLAGSIRDERRSRRSGFAVVREKLKTLIETEILPPYLELSWQEQDEESKVQRGRSFLLAAQALKAAKEAGFLSREEGQAQLVKDGHITVEVEPPEEIKPPPPPTPPMLPPPANGNTQDQLDKVPASEGGRGDIVGNQVQRGPDLGDETISAVPRDSSAFDQLAAILRAELAGMLNRMERPRLLKLVKTTTRRMFEDVQQAMVNLSNSEIPAWREERLEMWFTQRAEGDELLDNIFDSEDWWQIRNEVIPAIALVFRLSFNEGAATAAQAAQEFLYTEGLRDSPSIIGLNFDLKNPTTLAQLEQNAAELVRRVNDGTKFYLRRIITAGVDEGLSSPNIAQMIRDGANADAVLKEAGYTERVIDVVRSEVQALSESRVTSIVNTEINAAESEGRRQQWQQMGLTKKAWMHTGPDQPCLYCQANMERGYIGMDEPFEGVFGEVQAPPAHPGVDHCHLMFDEAELINKADSLQVWTGV